MRLDALQITIEPFALSPNLKVLRIKVKRYPGGELNLERILYEDDFRSFWDYAWESAGEEVKKAFEKEYKDNKLR